VKANALLPGGSSILFLCGIVYSAEILHFSVRVDAAVSSMIVHLFQAAALP